MGRKGNFCSVPDPGCLENTFNMQKNRFAFWYFGDVSLEKKIQVKTPGNSGVLS